MPKDSKRYFIGIKFPIMFQTGNTDSPCLLLCHPCIVPHMGMHTIVVFTKMSLYTHVQLYRHYNYVQLLPCNTTEFLQSTDRDYLDISSKDDRYNSVAILLAIVGSFIIIVGSSGILGAICASKLPGRILLIVVRKCLCNFCVSLSVCCSHMLCFKQ